MRRSYLKEGEVQLTALNSLLTQSRYLFLFSDLLLVAKQKAENSYKLKEKVRLDRLWIASNNCPHSFLIGWPICNYIAHFPSEEKKIEWHDIIEERIQKCRLKAIPKFTTLPLLVRISGRTQIMKKKLTMSQTSADLLVQLIGELGIVQDVELELAFDNGAGDEPTVLQGPETVYCIVMDFVRSTGYRLSEKQLERLDTFPLVNCRLVLFSSNAQRPNPAQTFVTHFKRVLSRSESRRFFGRHLDGSCPPQPVLTMMDHLLTNGVNTEGLFRKSPKQTTVRMIKAQLNRGSVPDFTQFNPHVTAAILKEYLRSIPGKLLQTCDLNMWIAAIESEGAERIAQIKGFIQLLPSSHVVLLSSLLRLLRAVAKSPSSKMNAQSLAVCIAPSLLDSPTSEVECAARRLPQIAEWLIMNAPLLFDDFTDAQCDMSSAASNDSGLSDVEVGVEASASPEFTETYVISTPASSAGSTNSSPTIRCRIHNLKMSPSSYCSSNLSTDDEMNICTEIEKDDDDKTPVLSRENSSVEKKPVAFIEWKAAKRERFLDVDSEESRWKENKLLKRRETDGALYRRRDESPENKCQEIFPSATHRPVEISLSTGKISASDGCKVTGVSLPTLPKFVEILNEAKEAEKQQNIKLEHLKLEKARAEKQLLPTFSKPAEVFVCPLPKNVDGVVQTTSRPADVAIPTFSKCTDVNASVYKDTSTSESNSKDHRNSHVRLSTSAIVKPRLKIATPRITEITNEKRSSGLFEEKERLVRKNLPTASIICYTESKLCDRPISNSAASRIKITEEDSISEPVTVTATKSLPIASKTQFTELRQRPSTSKAYEESVNAEIENKKQTYLQHTSSAPPMEHLKLTNAYSPKSPQPDKKFQLRPSNKLTPVQQRLRNRALASPIQASKTQFEIDIDVRADSEDSLLSKWNPPQAENSQQPSSPLTIKLPFYKPVERQNNYAPVQSVLSSTERSASNSAPGPEKLPPEVSSKRDFAISKTVEKTRLGNDVLRGRCDSFRKERKKNRSILMDPLEVNWSVDELRLKFQTEGSPPSLNTEYSPHT